MIVSAFLPVLEKEDFSFRTRAKRRVTVFLVRACLISAFKELLTVSMLFSYPPSRCSDYRGKWLKADTLRYMRRLIKSRAPTVREGFL